MNNEKLPACSLYFMVSTLVCCHRELDRGRHFAFSYEPIFKFHLPSISLLQCDTLLYSVGASSLVCCNFEGLVLFIRHICFYLSCYFPSPIPFSFLFLVVPLCNSPSTWNWPTTDEADSSYGIQEHTHTAENNFQLQVCRVDI